MSDGQFSTDYQVISYYPKYQILDNLSGGFNRIDLFIDLKNVMEALYYEDFAKFITAKYLKHRMMDYAMLTSLLTYTAWHKTYAKRRSKDIHIHYFLESGSSTYHKHISKEYKTNRQQTSMALSEIEVESFKDIFQRNLDVFKKVARIIPNVSVYHLKHFEADFVPHWVCLNYLDKHNIKSSRIIYSKDHDMVQVFLLNNVKIFYRGNAANMKIIDSSNFLERTFKIKDTDEQSCKNFVPWINIMNSVVGDAGDVVIGVKGIGYSTFIKNMKKHNLLKEFDREVTPDDFFSILDTLDEKTKKLNFFSKIFEHKEDIIRNFKLVSYTELCKHIPITVLEELTRSCDESQKQIVKPIVLTEALKPAGIIFDTMSLY